LHLFAFGMPEPGVLFVVCSRMGCVCVCVCVLCVWLGRALWLLPECGAGNACVVCACEIRVRVQAWEWVRNVCVREPWARCERVEVSGVCGARRRGRVGPREGQVEEDACWERVGERLAACPGMLRGRRAPGPWPSVPGAQGDGGVRVCVRDAPGRNKLSRRRPSAAWACDSEGREGRGYAVRRRGLRHVGLFVVSQVLRARAGG
jgi:hypothetical protein